mgnify:FL=1
MVEELKVSEFLSTLSSKQPVPGGGGASAAVGAFASALGMMVTNLTIGKKKYIDVEAEMEDIRSRLEALQQELVGLTDRDAEAFEPLSRAYGLPKETEEQRIEKERVMEKALYEASVVPLQIMKTVFRVMEDLEVLGEKGSRLAVSDVGVAVLFARAALEGASLNIYINTRLMKNREQAERLNKESDELIAEAGRLQEKIYTGVLAKIR